MSATNSDDQFDLIVIGAGPGGYVCAIRAAQLGMRVACIDRRGTPGGTCLNVGCIPSKAMLHSSAFYRQTTEHSENMGVIVKPVLDLNKMRAFKQTAIDDNVQGVRFLLKKNKIEEIIGDATLADKGKVSVALNGGAARMLAAPHIVIASGSESTPLTGVDVDEKNIVSSTGALDFETVPQSLLVIGAGVIGLELGSVWARLGTDVHVVEYLDRIIPGTDVELAKTLQRILTQQGITFQLDTKVTGFAKRKGQLEVTLEQVRDGANRMIRVEKVLVATGRRPHTDGLDLEAHGVMTDEQGRIIVDKKFATHTKGIYALGDVIAGPMLAHKAEDEGVALAENLVGKSGHVDYNAIPSVIYTEPEVAFVGASEDELKTQNIAYNVGKYPFLANGRAKANQTTDGFVKILVDAKSDRILGAHIIGPQAGELITSLVLAMSVAASAEDVARTCHAHPTLSEAIKEAAMACENRAIHM